VGIKQAITKPVVGSSSIDDKDVVVVRGTANGGRSSVKLYFDKQSGVLLRQVRYADTIIGRVPIQVDYSDYRDAAGAGVKLPFHVRLQPLSASPAFSPSAEQRPSQLER
jgi:hypothetical protein